MRSTLVLSVALAACGERFVAVDVPADADIEHGGHHGDGGACETVGRTGAADTCTLFAYCGHRHFEIDCSARFTCVCSEPDVDGGQAKQVVAAPAFCTSEASELRASFEAARRACGW